MFATVCSKAKPKRLILKYKFLTSSFWTQKLHNKIREWNGGVEETEF
jgi:hypothetical protein